MPFQLAIGPRVRKSPFYDATVKAGVTGFTIYNRMFLPESYGDPAGEYDNLINGVVMWDVAAERQVEVAGTDAFKLVRYLTPRNLSKFAVGQGKYLPVCNHDGHVINDPICLKLAQNRYWFSIADSEMLLWAQAVACERKLDVTVTEPDASPLAIQGPKAEAVVADLFGAWPARLKYFWFRKTKLDGIPLLVARSGWSKQGGFELYLLDSSRGTDLWNAVARAGRKHAIIPGCPNDIERVESALYSHGTDNLPDSTPFEINLGKYVDLEQRTSFIGKAALIRANKAGPKRRLTGLFIAGRALAPNEDHWPLFRRAKCVGRVSMVAHSPRLKKNIALAQVATDVPDTATDLTTQTPSGTRKVTITGIPFC